MRILFVTQTIDVDHPVLAQTVDLVRELSSRFESVTVVCGSVGRHDLPASVALRSFAAPTRAGRLWRFLQAVASSVGPSSERPAAVLVHMVPVFAVLLAPLAKARKVPILLWYTHWHAGRSLRAATRLADVVLSVSEGSFPLQTPKLRATGHAIDVDRFAPAGARDEGRLRLLALGRTARWKGYDTLLGGFERATAAGLDASLEVRGPQLTDDERAHRRELEATIAASPVLDARVRLEDALPRAQLPALLALADALVSATQPRVGETLDKVVYEAAACGVPVLASNAALDEFLGDLPLELRFRPGDAAGLAELLLAFAAAPAELRTQTGAELRRRVVAGHSVASWADQVAAIVAAQSRE